MDYKVVAIESYCYIFAIEITSTLISIELSYTIIDTNVNLLLLMPNSVYCYHHECIIDITQINEFSSNWDVFIQILPIYLTLSTQHSEFLVIPVMPSAFL